VSCALADVQDLLVYNQSADLCPLFNCPSF
jgi:hypothetical protein